jgi:hypothetical protein
MINHSLLIITKIIKLLNITSIVILKFEILIFAYFISLNRFFNLPEIGFRAIHIGSVVEKSREISSVSFFPWEFERGLFIFAEKG